VQESLSSVTKRDLWFTFVRAVGVGPTKRLADAGLVSLGRLQKILESHTDSELRHHQAARQLRVLLVVGGESPADLQGFSLL
jgi:hypothetical protein